MSTLPSLVPSSVFGHLNAHLMIVHDIYLSSAKRSRFGFASLCLVMLNVAPASVYTTLNRRLSITRHKPKRLNLADDELSWTMASNGHSNAQKRNLAKDLELWTALAMRSNYGLEIWLSHLYLQQTTFLFVYHTKKQSSQVPISLFVSLTSSFINSFIH